MPTPKTYEFTKDSTEKFDVQITYLNDDGSTTYTISSLSVTAVDSAGNDVASTVIDSGSNSYSTNIAYVWVQAGTAGQVYNIEASATMSTGQVLTKKLKMRVV